MTGRISVAESQIMEALWVQGPMSSEDLTREVGEAQGWGRATVKTLTNRLLKKKAIASVRDAGKVRYVPLVTREEYLTGESQGLLDRLFDGQLAPLVAHYAKHRALTPAELQRIKALIAELETGDD